MIDLKRNIESNISELLKFFPIVLITGARQTGKTTLAKRICPDWSYYDLQNGRDLDYISRDYDFFFKEEPAQVIIDEAQELPQLFRELRGVVDASREQKGRFLLTGSSSPELVKEASESLAGRIGIIEVGTFKINEVSSQPLPKFYEIFQSELKLSDLQQLLAEAEPSKLDPLEIFLKGGYPEPILADDLNFHRSWMENYYQTYLNRDIKRLFPKLDSIKYRRFLDMLAALSGTIINKASLGRSVDSSEVTIRDYLEIAHSTFVWRIIPSYEKSKVKSVVKMPKGIFRDSGLCHYLNRIETRQQMLRSPHVGTSFEAFVTEEMIKGINALNIGRFDYYYYRTRNGSEVDLILEGTFGTLPIEIKLAASTQLKSLISLRKFIKDHQLPYGIVINNSDQVKMLCDEIIQIPIHYI